MYPFHVNRRNFLATTAGAALAATPLLSSAARPPVHRVDCWWASSAAAPEGTAC